MMIACSAVASCRSVADQSRGVAIQPGPGAGRVASCANTGDARITAAAAIPASFIGSPKSVLPSFRLDPVCVARFVILSNGDIHFLWDFKQGNPNLITMLSSPVRSGWQKRLSRAPFGKACVLAGLVPVNDPGMSNAIGECSS